MNLSAQEYLAKLLAKENLSVQHGNYSTASFDVINRVLRLPLWADKGKDVYDLLVGHEVGHALFTPADGWHDSDKKFNKIPKAYLNIVEDIRIERMIQDQYPGIVNRFKAGYKRLFDDDLFGTAGRDMNKEGLMDRLNVHSKGRGIVPIEFSPEETPLIDEAMTVKTWNDVVVVCQKIYDFIEANKEEQEQPETPMEKAKDPLGDSAGETSTEGDEPMSAEELENEFEKAEADSESTGPAPVNGSDDDPYEDQTEGHVTWTENTQRENEKDLLAEHVERNKYERSGQPEYSSGVSDTNLERMTYSYAKAKALRETMMTDKPETNYAGESSYPYESLECKEDWSNVKKTYKTQANLIAKDFERKKAAFEYSRATTAKSGKLDPLKMHSYKYSEDIFLATTNLAQAKSHGIIMYLDLSGSMCEIIEDVTAQAITIAMFCRQVNIPFEAYAFTTTPYWREVGEGMTQVTPEASEIEGSSTKIVEMFSSKMNKKTFDEAAFMSFAIGKSHSYNRRTPYHMSSHMLHQVDQMGSTPLIQTVFHAAKITNAFTKKHALQNTNVMFLTDGQPDGVYISKDDLADVNTHRSQKLIKMGNKLIEGSGGREIYKNALIRLKEMTGATVMGFALATDASSFGSAYNGVDGGLNRVEFADVIKGWRKNSFTSYKNVKGYDDYFIIKINKSARFDSDEFTPKKAETISDLKREFKKFNSNKKGNKQLVAKITDAVAA